MAPLVILLLFSRPNDFKHGLLESDSGSPCFKKFHPSLRVSDPVYQRISFFYPDRLLIYILKTNFTYSHCFIYWCTWGTDSKIERISLDGDISTRLTIHSQRRSKPKNLIIDFTTNRLFWLDAQHGTIGSRHLDGGHIFYEVEPSPLSIAVFEDIIYWIGSNKQTIFMMNKLTGVNGTLYNSTMNADLIFAFHEQLQPAGELLFHLHSIIFGPIDVCPINSPMCVRACVRASVRTFYNSDTDFLLFSHELKVFLKMLDLLDSAASEESEEILKDS